MHRAALWIVGLIGAEIVCGIMNVDLSSDRKQQQQRIEDRRQFDAVSVELDRERGAIGAMQAQLESMFLDMNAQQSRIADLKRQLSAVERRYPAGIPPDAYPRYRRDLKRHNALVEEYYGRTQTYKSLYADYTARTDQYNQKAQGAYEMARKMGKGWCAAPIPLIVPGGPVRDGDETASGARGPHSSGDTAVRARAGAVSLPRG
jgi:hypothetical protein